MKVMYIAPRFHTNQSAIVKGWLERGDEVLFISYYTAIIEDYSCIKPVVLGFSPLYQLFDKFYVDVLRRKDLTAATFKINHGFPPIGKLHRMIKNWKPDIIIMRDRTLYTIAAYLLGPKSKCILYNQSPVWDNPPKQDLAHKIVRKLTPKYRMTPVMGKKEPGKIVGKRTYFVPFAVEAKAPPEQKHYFQKDRINILCIGKFEPRKHHMMLMDVVKEIKSESGENIHLTIIGEATGRHQKEFLKKVEAHTAKNHYEDLVTILTNIPRSETDNYYRNADVFVIPSTDEMASISQLEAMGFAVPVICSDTNGSACYVKEGKWGYLFRDCDRDDLKRKLSLLTGERDRIVQMGAAAYRAVSENYLFKNYYEGIRTIIKDMEA